MGDTRHYPVFETDAYGLTKREYAAIKIMAGFAANSRITASVVNAAVSAVESADALFDALESAEEEG